MAVSYLRLARFSRHFSTSLIKQETNATKGTKTTNDAKKFRALDGLTYFPNNFDKTILVWTKRYPSRDKVPREISVSTITESRSKARIKVCNYLVLLTMVLCIYNIYSGRLLGSALEERTEGIDFHKQIRQDYIASLNTEESNIKK